MDVRQIQARSFAASDLAPLAQIKPGLVLVFGDIGLLDAPGAFEALKSAFPDAGLVGCSTSGEITARGVDNGAVVITAVRFDAVRLAMVEAAVAEIADSAAAGAELGKALAAPDLAMALVFGKGVGINGSALIDGLTAEIGPRTPVSGGLAGDGGAFTRTLTVTPSGIHDDKVVAVGFYGDQLRVGSGSYGGWAAFGPARRVTRCEGAILYELDDQSALDLYRRYLGEYACKLPASGLLFPFEMLDGGGASVGLIRTILGVDEERGALVLAGDIDPSGYLRLMHASTSDLIDGAETAARRARDALGGKVGAGLGLLVSCIGRKLVMGDAVDEEVEAVAGALGENLTLTGFYSNGEIGPLASATDCKLHNQTMTVTVIGEGDR